MDSNGKKCCLMILALMAASGFIFYYMFLKPEHFTVIESFTDDDETISPDDETTPTDAFTFSCPTQQPPPWKSIISKVSGIGLNVNAVTPQGGISNSDQQLYVIESIPTTKTDVLGGVYAIDSNNLLTIVIKNDNDINQFWTLNKMTDSTGTTCYNVMPYVQNVSGVQYALQYENGNLSFRPHSPSFTAQQWLASQTVFTKGIPILNYNPISLYSPEFNAFGNNTISSNNLNDQNNKQVNDVVNLIKQSVQQYMSQLTASTSGTNNISSSSFGNSANPLNINVMLEKQSTSNFANVPTPTGSNMGYANIADTNDVISLLDKYESAANPPVDNSGFMLYKKTDLQNSLQSKIPITSINMNDYVQNPVSSCNCKL